MSSFTEAFGLTVAPAGVDFVDIDMSTDMPLFIDPYAIQIRQDDWSDRCGDHIRSFFNTLLEALREDDSGRAGQLLNHLHEPNETHLGVSTGRPRGRGVGDHKAALLADALVRSRAFQTGVLSEISEAELFIRGVGRDTISDLTTNVIRGLLAEYTAEQCRLHNVPTTAVGSIGPTWDIQGQRWQGGAVQLPIWQQRPILLVPKFSVRHRLSLDSQEFWNHHMIEFLRQEYQDAGSSLAHVLRSGERRVSKKSVKERHPLVKDDLADFVRQHPEVLDHYKSLQGAKGPLDQEEINQQFDEAAFASALIAELPNIAEGNAEASHYHSFAMGICTFLFYPNLIYPVKEHEIHQGRKRIDIKYTNAAETGFFHQLMALPQTRARNVFMECKNYRKELQNPELDQMSGRFGHQRGFFGIVLCRHMDDRVRIISRCRDTVNDGRGYIIVLEDADLISMLRLVEGHKRDNIDNSLQRRFDEIAN